MSDYLLEQLAVMRREIADLKRARVTYRAATVTAVDKAARTFTADLGPDAGRLSGIPVQQKDHFLPAPGDNVLLSLSGATPVYLPHRIAEGAIGRDELDEDVTVTLDAASGKNAVTFSPDPAPDPDPAAATRRTGDIWWQRSGTRIVGAWQWDGATWEPHTFGDQVLDTLTAGKITSGQIAAGVDITIGDPAGEHTSIDNQRLGFLAPAPDASPVEVTRFGRTSGGVDPATGLQTWAIDEQGNASVQGLSVTGDPIFGGTPLSASLAPLGRFHAGASLGSLTDPAQTPPGGGEASLFEATVELFPGRIYLIQTSNLWVRRVAGDATTRIDVNLRYTVSTTEGVDPPAVSITSPPFTRWVEGALSDLGHGVLLSRVFRPAAYAHFRFLLSLGSVGGRAYIEMGSENHTLPGGVGLAEPEIAQLFAVDLGEHPWTNRMVRRTSGDPPAPAPKKRYTYEYFSHWSRWFRGDGSVAGNNGDCYQGRTPYYTANGDQASQIGNFTRPNGGPSLQADLAGATVEKLEVYLYAEHWHSMSGGTAVIRYHNNTNPGSLNNYAGDLRVGGWARGQGRWVDITSWASLFAGTGAKGIQVGPANSTDPIFYGIFSGPGSANPPKIRATFTR